ncbi:hypothetical protein I3F55_11475 [Streptomyces sp. MUM 16J]|nr:hypothetical protein [Streptomyces sp. MUM 16J]
MRPKELGVCDAHDHLFLRSPRLPGRELDDVSTAQAELTAFRAAGGAAVVLWTPYGRGRRATELSALSRITGVRVVWCGSGWQRRWAPNSWTASSVKTRDGLSRSTGREWPGPFVPVLPSGGSGP